MIVYRAKSPIIGPKLLGSQVGGPRVGKIPNWASQDSTVSYKIHTVCHIILSLAVSYTIELSQLDSVQYRILLCSTGYSIYCIVYADNL